MLADDAYAFFGQLIAAAEDTLVAFTASTALHTTTKADNTIVTACDQAIDDRLSRIAETVGLPVVSEEGEHLLAIVEAGDYLTIDPIDGTLGYIEYVNHALDAGGINHFLDVDLGARSDFCLLLAIVEGGAPRFGAVHNFVTGETILVDGLDPTRLVRTNHIRVYEQRSAIYVDPRPGPPIERELVALTGVGVNMQATLGLKAIYTIVNPHESAVVVHRVQGAGLWDVMPAAVAARAFGGDVYDDLGHPLEYRSYIGLPGKGATVVKGDRFQFVVERLRDGSA